MNRFYKIIILIIEIIFIYIILFSNLKLICLSKLLFNLSCPACGLTRAFRSLLKLEIKEAIYYNFLSPIILVFLIFINIFLIYDIITNHKKTNKFLNKLGNHYNLIIIILIISTIINNIKGI